MRRIFQFGFQLYLLTKFVNRVFPRVDLELDRWRSLGNECPNENLSKQALASIMGKRFHAQGGSFYALYPKVKSDGFIPLIVALQTISDYLDNLCDRAGVQDEKSFRQLHLAMIEALDPSSQISDYYLYYPHKKDGGYLENLVLEVRKNIKLLPTYHLVKDDVIQLTQLYVDLQCYKHLPLNCREERLKGWAEPYLYLYDELFWWEFSAATGSTLGTFVLCAAAANPKLTPAEAAGLKDAYFPWICGLHILLDYFIDQEEDIVGGDLNFVSYYLDKDSCQRRLHKFLDMALIQINNLPNSAFHLTAIQGLLALYLSDGKASNQELIDISKTLVNRGGNRTKLFHKMCKFLREKEVI